jgi:hypothetical protein
MVIVFNTYERIVPINKQVWGYAPGKIIVENQRFDGDKNTQYIAEQVFKLWFPGARVTSLLAKKF